MIRHMKLALTIGACTLAMPVAAQQATTAFDGSYTGVSTDIEAANRDLPRSRCPHLGLPDPLIIASGVVKSPMGKGWTGTVSPEGALAIHNQLLLHVEGQIDPQGTATAEFHGPQCIVKFVWRKQAG